MKDLGTYFIKVTFTNNDGFIYSWDTGGRFTNGSNNISPLDATFIKPNWENEEELLGSIYYQFYDGNYSCDCNRKTFLDRAKQNDRNEHECGDTLKIKSLIVITPDGRNIDLTDK